MGIITYRQSDRIKIVIHDVELSIKPLSYGERLEASSFIQNSQGIQSQNMLELTKSLIKNCLKEIKGIFYPDGTEMKLEFDPDGKVKEDKIDELLNSSMKSDLTIALGKIMNGIPEAILNMEGKPHEYIKIVHPESAMSFKKK